MAFLKEYTYLGELGKGGYATVYKVRHNQYNCVRAVRVLNDPVVEKDSDVYKSFLRECQVLLRLGNGNHSNIVHINRPYCLDNQAFVEMDYVDGCNLGKYLKNNKNFISCGEVLRMVKEISSALAYCHEDIYKFCLNPDEDQLEPDPINDSKFLIDDIKRQELINRYRVIHNDIHSGNIMRKEDGGYVLLDFGLAIEGNEVVISSFRHDNGAPAFMPPEKFDKEKSKLTEQSDIYSLGVVMYEFLAGRVPFVCNGNSFDDLKNLYDLVKAHEIPSIFDLRKYFFEEKYHGLTYEKDYPDWLEKTILKCLEKDPAKRFRNGKELYEHVVKHFNNNDIPDHYEELINLKIENKTLSAQLIETQKKLIDKQEQIQQLQNDYQILNRRICKSCGTVSPPDSKHCKKCGKALD